jgi:5-(carboxyamino)imidazole ribonucleotide synthase
MTAMAARVLGYHVHCLDPDPSCAARFVVERCWTAPFDDATAAAELARSSQVVTLEIEKIPLSSLEAAAREAPLRPATEVLAIIQDRARQKRWLADHHFPMGPYREAHTTDELAAAVRALGGPCFAKTRVGGYDGGGQAQLSSPEEVGQAWQALGGRACVVERALALEAELSVLVARSCTAEVAVYPPALNHHHQRILDWSVLPGPLPSPVVSRALEMGRALAEALRIEGLLVVELFLTQQGELLVNELAPRPHNSFHTTEVACLTSQFEQAVRAVTGLPLGDTRVTRPSAIVNLLGDLWLGAQPPDFDRALAQPGVKLFLYGKRLARPGRKMGHLLAVGDTPEEAVARVRAAQAQLLRAR